MTFSQSGSLPACDWVAYTAKSIELGKPQGIMGLPVGRSPKEPMMPKLKCTGKDNAQREFEYAAEMNELDGTYDVMVQTVPTTHGPSYELRLKPEAGQWRIDAVTHHGLDVYKEKGIIYALIPALAAELDADIVSSPRKRADDAAIKRTTAADSYWERLKGRGQATYDDAKDVYTFPKPAKPPAEPDVPKEEPPAAGNDGQK